eukprot:7679161-Pyramimonas_sp.AAC.2
MTKRPPRRGASPVAMRWPLRAVGSRSGYTLTTDQSDAGSAGIFCARPAEICARLARAPGIFSRRTNQMQEARVYSHDGPIRRRKC